MNNHATAQIRIHLKTNLLRRVELSRMKKSFVILLGAILCLSACAPAYYYGPAYGPAPAAGYAVAVGDRPYYTHGPYYAYGGVRYVWVAGHWGRHHGRRVWIHGRYIVRG